MAFNKLTDKKSYQTSSSLATVINAVQENIVNTTSENTFGSRFELINESITPTTSPERNIVSRSESVKTRTTKFIIDNKEIFDELAKL